MNRKEKNKGKAIYFLWGRTAFTEVKSEKLRLFRRYCEGTGKRKQEKNIKKEISN